MYDALADVYAFLVPDALLEPSGAADAFAPLLPAGARRVLDCACGTGELAVGLALRGLEVRASDASAGMVARTRALASRHGVALDAAVRSWEALGSGPEPGLGAGAGFDAVLCVGNSLTHAHGVQGRRAALAGMRAVLAPGGALVLTSRVWEAVRARRPGLEVADRLVMRGGVRGLVVRAWTIPDAWDAPHAMETAVVLLGDDGTTRTVAEELRFWPFTREDLHADLAATGFEVTSDSWTPDGDRYAVTARATGSPPPAPAAS